MCKSGQNADIHLLNSQKKKRIENGFTQSLSYDFISNCKNSNIIYYCILIFTQKNLFKLFLFPIDKFVTVHYNTFEWLFK